MNTLFEDLFITHCAPYRPDLLPEYLRVDPVRGYGQYTFEEGFRLGFKLAVSCLDPEDLHRLE